MCALIGFGLIIICFRLLPYIERHLMSNSKNMNVFLEFDELTHIHPILTLIKEQNIQIYEVEIMSEKGMPADYPAAIFPFGWIGNRIMRRLSRFCQIWNMFYGLRRFEDIT